MKINFKRGITQLVGIVVGLGASVIGIALYAIVVTAFRDTQTAESLAWTISNAGLALFSGVTSQFGTIGTISGVLMLAGVMALFGVGGYALYNKVGK